MSQISLKIFYTDDDLDDQDFFKDAITDIDGSHNVYTQTNGDELLSLLNQPPPRPDLIFLDLNMPNKNGIEVLKEIRQSANLAHLPVIIFSTSNNEKAINTCREIGATMYLSKPNSYDALKAMMSSVLNMDWKSYNPSSSGSFYYS